MSNSALGSPDKDGWYHAPEGGWKTNPVPGTWVETRYPNLSSQQGPSEYIHDWTLVGSFRPAQQDSQPFEGLNLTRMASRRDQQDSQQGAGGGKPLELCGEQIGRGSCGLIAGHDGLHHLDPPPAHPSGHTGGPVAWRYRWDHWPEGVWSVASSDSKQEWIGVLGLTAQPLYAAPPAAQQDGGSGGGEAREVVARIIRSAISRRMAAEVDPVRSFNIKHRLAERDAAVEEATDAILSALQSAHPASGAEDSYAEALVTGSEQRARAERAEVKLKEAEKALESARASMEGECEGRHQIALNTVNRALTPQDGAVAGEGGAG